MARYVDIENPINVRGITFIDENRSDVLISFSEVRKALRMLPVADVVPRAEVEELIRENKASELIRKLRSKDEKAKTKVAQTRSKMEQVQKEIIRDIFEDFEKFVVKCLNTDWYWLEDMVRDVRTLEKKYKKYLIDRSEGE